MSEQAKKTKKLAVQKWFTLDDILNHDDKDFLVVCMVTDALKAQGHGEFGTDEIEIITNHSTKLLAVDDAGKRVRVEVVATFLAYDINGSVIEWT